MTHFKAQTPLVREDLADLHCPCGADHQDLVFNPVCHPHSTTIVAYNKDDGTLDVDCATCAARVVTLAVASRNDIAPAEVN